jgi:hypothetical protein
MQVLYVEDVANRNDPESCVGLREGAGEALIGEHVGRVSSLEKLKVQGADAVERSGRQHEAVRHGERRPALRGPRPLARVETTCMGTGISTGRPLGKVHPERSASGRAHP